MTTWTLYRVERLDFEVSRCAQAQTPSNKGAIVGQIIEARALCSEQCHCRPEIVLATDLRQRTGHPDRPVLQSTFTVPYSPISSLDAVTKQANVMLPNSLL